VSLCSHLWDFWGWDLLFLFLCSLAYSKPLVSPGLSPALTAPTLAAQFAVQKLQTADPGKLQVNPES
jgi:hypothetical protein